MILYSGNTVLSKILFKTEDKNEQDLYAPPQSYDDIVLDTTSVWNPLTLANVAYQYIQPMKNTTLIHNTTFDIHWSKLRLTFDDAKDYCQKLNAR